MLTAELTTEQAQLVALDCKEHVLVDAPAGTGKTHVLAARLSKLVEADGLSSGDEILVLSFSRAAVAELRRRLGALGGDARYAGASTFDSFASRILAADEGGDSWSAEGYEGRIRAATELLSAAAKPPGELSLLQHVLIDEFQDLVGNRASFVMALLGRAGCGFTIFGDPAQAIYDHQLGKEEAGPSNQDLYQWVGDRFATSLIRASLSKNFRTRSDRVRHVPEIGRLLRSPDVDQTAVERQLRTTILSLPSVSTLTARRMLTRTDGATTAILTRTNAEALRLSAQLYELGVPHRYQRPGQDKAVAAWLGTVVAQVDGPQTTRARLWEGLEAESAEVGRTPDELWLMLRRLDPRRGDSIDLRRIADLVRLGAIPEDLNEVGLSPTVVSTIHRAKGLEFDTVILVDSRLRRDGDLGQENRLLYVGLSRARSDLFSLPAPDTDGLRPDRPTGRWVRRGFGKSSWKVYEIEVFGKDTHTLHPAGAWLIVADVMETQQYLREHVNPGDSVELSIVRVTEMGEPKAFYAVRHAGRGVGLTSEAFSEALRSTLGSHRTPRWPERIEGLHVELVDTVAGHESVGRAAGLRNHGMWLRVRVFGLGRLVFHSEERGKDRPHV